MRSTVMEATIPMKVWSKRRHVPRGDGPVTPSDLRSTVMEVTIPMKVWSKRRHVPRGDGVPVTPQADPARRQHLAVDLDSEPSPGWERGSREPDVGQLDASRADAAVGVAEPEGTPSWRDIDRPPSTVEVGPPPVAGAHKRTASCGPAGGRREQGNQPGHAEEDSPHDRWTPWCRRWFPCPARAAS